MESQWLAQLRSMREAIAELKLDQQDGEVQAYGHDILVDDTGGSSSDDLWDVWGDEEETESSDLADGFEEDQVQPDYESTSYNRDWLWKKCFSLGTSRLNPCQLDEQLSALLASDMQGRPRNRASCLILKKKQMTSSRYLSPRL